MKPAQKIARARQSEFRKIRATISKLRRECREIAATITSPVHFEQILAGIEEPNRSTYREALIPLLPFKMS